LERTDNKLLAKVDTTKTGASEAQQQMKEKTHVPKAMI
jgi:hypothetical protein